VRRFVVDTNLYIDAIRTDDGNEALARFQRRFAPMLFQHATVVQEILASARDEADYRAYHQDWVAPFDDLGRVVTPSGACWARAALIIVRLVERRIVSPGGFARSFINDCLIAASARELGFVLVTRNVHDFERIARVEPGLELVLPWPER